MSLSLKIEVSTAGVAFMRNAFFGGLWFKSLVVECTPPNVLVEAQREQVVRLLGNIGLCPGDMEIEEEDLVKAKNEWNEMVSLLQRADLRHEFEYKGKIHVHIQPITC